MLVDIGGRKLHYEKIGQGQPLIMVHGNGENLHIFSESVALLKERFTVYTVDLAGHGESYYPKELHYTDHAEDLYAFINTLQLEKPVFYGFSDGGIIGILLAIQHPDLLGTLIASGANTVPKGLKFSARLGMRFRYLLSHSEKTRLMLEEPQITTEQLQTITVPTHLTAGEFDLISRKHTDYIKENIQGSTLKIFTGELHGSYVVHSEKIARYILEVL